MASKKLFSGKGSIVRTGPSTKIIKSKPYVRNSFTNPTPKTRTLRPS